MRLSLLLAARKNSKFLAKFVTSYFAYTKNITDIEVLAMLSAQDTWNKELVQMFQKDIQFFYEDDRLGRAGLHKYYNELASKSSGEWLIYFCDDHYINTPDWDESLLSYVERWDLDYHYPHMIIPVWDNIGTVNQMLSRGWYEAVGHMGMHGNIDSYVNFVAAKVPAHCIIQTHERIFHDFTFDPEIMTPIHSELEGRRDGVVPEWGSDEINRSIDADAQKIIHAIQGQSQVQ